MDLGMVHKLMLRRKNSQRPIMIQVLHNIIFVATITFPVFFQITPVDRAVQYGGRQSAPVLIQICNQDMSLD